VIFLNNNVKVLQYIESNVEMGIYGIDSVVDEVTQNDFLTLLNRERNEFEVISKEAKKLLEKYNSEEKELSKFAKLGTDLSSKMMIDKENPIGCIAKMMIDGTNKGIIAVTEKINNYKIDDNEILELANKLKATLEHNIEDLKPYL
jgi:hypothetical protein